MYSVVYICVSVLYIVSLSFMPHLIVIITIIWWYDDSFAILQSDALSRMPGLPLDPTLHIHGFTDLQFTSLPRNLDAHQLMRQMPYTDPPCRPICIDQQYLNPVAPPRSSTSNLCRSPISNQLRPAPHIYTSALQICPTVLQKCSYGTANFWISPDPPHIFQIRPTSLSINHANSQFLHQPWAVYLLYAGTDAWTVWGVTVAGVSVVDVSFHARTDAGTRVLRLTPWRTTWLKLKDQHCLSDNVNN